MAAGYSVSEPLLCVEHLTTAIEVDEGVLKPVNDVSFKIEAGEVLGLVGESGSGKTMAARSVMRLLPRGARIVGGRVELRGRELVGLSERELRKVRGAEISMIFQDPRSALDPVQRCGNAVKEALRLNGEDPSRVLEILNAVGIPVAERTKDLFPFQLSEGMCQRVMAAVALACNPAILIADEPTTNLDVTIQAGFVELLKDLRVRFNLSILFISHDLGLVADLCDRIAVMYGGRIVEQGPADSVIGDPKHPYTAALVDCIPRLRSGASTLTRIPGQVPELLELPSGCAFHPRCAYVMDRCRSEAPESFVVDDSVTRCFLHAESAR